VGSFSSWHALTQNQTGLPSHPGFYAESLTVKQLNGTIAVAADFNPDVS
jgi:hypothetical protein